MPFTPLKKVMGKVLRECRLTGDLDAYKAFLLWNDIVGEKISNHTKPVKIKDGILYIEVDDPMWLAQIKYMKLDIIEKFDIKIKKGIFKDIKFYLR